MLGSSRVAAQTRGSYYAGPLPAASSATTAAQPGRAAAPAPAPPTGGLLTIRGTVTDSATHEGLPGVTVLLKGTDTGVSTDVNGAFALPVAASTTPIHLIFSSVGFTSQEKVVAASSQPLTVALAADTRMLAGEVVIIGGVYQRPWPWHPRRFFNWGKYWVTKPFRP
ncbi:carboxypeptidase-like regulatory domain-containing protein [Hymenobacter sp. BRD128]|uniref:carboxypeptidase-like regulatory domain-containing protein n=1 Tax=Hymenobacter sp. BRD128 TaxID=2675878 RepID=UPI00156444CB|nr:carboxypeptidase-like regulatory domain-containing protein [Hymenobacter sp. BRD128]QKG58367.1 carboxypeptidase-like regulatory domain-containing protein [Hymenobacter sp. BRD128]